MYRALTLYLLENNISFDNEETIKEHLNKININFEEGRIFLNGKDVTEKIREHNVERKVSKVSGFRSVREKMVKEQRKMASKYSIVVEGRDTGSVVFPYADYKFYLDASIDERANRKYKELKEKDQNVELKDIKKEIEERDFLDINRKLSPLIKPTAAFIIDTTNLSIEEVLEKMLSYIKEKRQK